MVIFLPCETAHHYPEFLFHKAFFPMKIKMTAGALSDREGHFLSHDSMKSKKETATLYVFRLLKQHRYIKSALIQKYRKLP